MYAILALQTKGHFWEYISVNCFHTNNTEYIHSKAQMVYVTMSGYKILKTSHDKSLYIHWLTRHYLLHRAMSFGDWYDVKQNATQSIDVTFWTILRGKFTCTCWVYNKRSCRHQNNFTIENIVYAYILYHPSFFGSYVLIVFLGNAWFRRYVRGTTTPRARQ